MGNSHASVISLLLKYKPVFTLHLHIAAYASKPLHPRSATVQEEFLFSTLRANAETSQGKAFHTLDALPPARFRKESHAVFVGVITACFAPNFKAETLFNEGVNIFLVLWLRDLLLSHPDLQL